MCFPFFSFLFFYAWSSSCDLNTTAVKINFSTDGRETVEMEQPAGVFPSLFGDLGISWILLVPVTQNSDESSTLLVKSPCFCQVVFFGGGGALCAIHYFKGTDMLS